MLSGFSLQNKTKYSLETSFLTTNHFAFIGVEMQLICVSILCFCISSGVIYYLRTYKILLMQVCIYCDMSTTL